MEKQIALVNKTTNRVLKKELAKGYFRVSLSKENRNMG
jgi:hypothetical protein